MHLRKSSQKSEITPHLYPNHSKFLLSNGTISFGAFIVVSSAFMLQVRIWLFKVFGNFFILTCFSLCFILIYMLTVYNTFKMHLSPLKISAVSIIFLLGYLLTMWQTYFSEKTHILTYGILGYMAANDLINAKRAMQLKNIAIAAIFISFISALDEIFQGILPYRFAELKDFVTNIVSGVLGIGFLITLKKPSLQY